MHPSDMGKQLPMFTNFNELLNIAISEANYAYLELGGPEDRTCKLRRDDRARLVHVFQSQPL